MSLSVALNVYDDDFAKVTVFPDRHGALAAGIDVDGMTIVSGNGVLSLASRLREWAKEIEGQVDVFDSPIPEGPYSFAVVSATQAGAL